MALKGFKSHPTYKKVQWGVSAGAGVGVLAALASAIGLLDIVEHKFYDLRMRLTAELDRASADLVCVLIDNASLSAIKNEVGDSWVWEHERYAALVEYFHAQGARTVVFDMLFPDAPDAFRADWRERVDEAWRDPRNHPRSHNWLLARAAEDFGHAHLGAAFSSGVSDVFEKIDEAVLHLRERDPDDPQIDALQAEARDLRAAKELVEGHNRLAILGPDETPPAGTRGLICARPLGEVLPDLPLFADHEPPYRELAETFRGIATPIMLADSDGITRRMPLFVGYGTRDRAKLEVLIPSLPFSAALDALQPARLRLDGRRQLTLEYDGDRPPLVVPLDRAGNMLVRYHGPLLADPARLSEYLASKEYEEIAALPPAERWARIPAPLRSTYLAVDYFTTYADSQNFNRARRALDEKRAAEREADARLAAFPADLDAWLAGKWADGRKLAAERAALDAGTVSYDRLQQIAAGEKQFVETLTFLQYNRQSLIPEVPAFADVSGELLDQRRALSEAVAAALRKCAAEEHRAAGAADGLPDLLYAMERARLDKRLAAHLRGYLPPMSRAQQAADQRRTQREQLAAEAAALEGERASARAGRLRAMRVQAATAALPEESRADWEALAAQLAADGGRDTTPDDALPAGLAAAVEAALTALIEDHARARAAVAEDPPDPFADRAPTDADLTDADRKRLVEGAVARERGGIERALAAARAARAKAETDLEALRATLSTDGLFRDKIVVIGASATGLKDLKPTPFSKDDPGLMIHTSVLDNLLQGQEQGFLHTAKPWQSWILALLVCVLSAALATALPRVWMSMLGILAFLALFAYVNTRLFAGGLVFDLATPVLGAVLSFLAGTLIGYFTEGRDKKQVRGMLDKYVSPSVAATVMTDPEKAKLGGDRKEMTVYFSDLAGFTTLSEMLPAEELVELLNEYLGRMTDTIMKRYEGTLDKYIGDAVMAFWNAPVPQPDHAQRCCFAALDNFRALVTWREALMEDEGHPRLDQRIGINTGPMVVGNTGSETRQNYTVLGDPVNLAARLEAANKSYGTNLMIGEHTFRACRDRVIVRELDTIAVKGKHEGVKVYELLARVNEVARDGSKKEKRLVPELTEAQLEWVRRYEEGLACYRRMEWDPAIAAFESCIAARAACELPPELCLAREEKAAKVMIERCRALKESPPVASGAAWDGIYRMTTK